MPNRLIVFISIIILLTACRSGNTGPQISATQPPGFGYTPLTTILAAPHAGVITTAGYYYNSGDGPILVDSLSFSGVQPAPLDEQPNQQVWLGTAISADVQNGLRTQGAVSYAPLLATGTIDGPGAYGPGGRYAFQLSGPRLTLLVPVALTVTALLQKSFSYDGQFVQVKGTLLMNADSALLLDELGPGGVPPRTSRQIKLAEPIRDKQLLTRLTASASGNARYGEVQIEGFWRSGQLLPLGIVPGP
jgi:hypothetical protein